MMWPAFLPAWLGLRREATAQPPAPPRPPGAIPVAAVGDPPRPRAPVLLVPPELLRRLGATDPARWVAPLSAACLAAGITTPRRLAAFLATVAHESGGFRRLVESLDYSAEGLAETWPARFAEVPAARPRVPNDRARALGRWRDSRGQVAPAQQEAIAAAVYGGRLGNRSAADAWRFRGRGLVQLTGRADWERLAAELGRPLDSLDAWLLTPAGAAESAARFWTWRGGNQLADAGDLAALRRAVNGGAIGLDAFLALEAVAREVLGAELVA